MVKKYCLVYLEALMIQTSNPEPVMRFSLRLWLDMAEPSLIKNCSQLKLAYLTVDHILQYIFPLGISL